MPKDKPTSQGLILLRPDEAKILEIVERVLYAKETQRDVELVEEREATARELQRAVLEIRDAIKMQANSINELTRAIQLVVGRGSSGVGGF